MTQSHEEVGHERSGFAPLCDALALGLVLVFCSMWALAALSGTRMIFDDYSYALANGDQDALEVSDLGDIFDMNLSEPEFYSALNFVRSGLFCGLW